MFWFCKPKPIDVYFYTTREEIFNHAKPKKATAHIPEWFKKLQPPHFSKEDGASLKLTRTLRTCPGFINLYRSGFMFPLWSDLSIHIKPSGEYFYRFADGRSSMENHNAEQFAGSTFEQNYVELKLINPWFWEAKEKIDFLFSSPTWNGFGYENAVVAPGIYNPQIAAMPANINLLFKKQTEDVIYELNFGQPLVHMIPLSDRPIKLHYKLVTEDELQKIVAKSPIGLMFKNKFVRAEKLCPHA